MNTIILNSKLNSNDRYLESIIWTEDWIQQFQIINSIQIANWINVNQETIWHWKQHVADTNKVGDEMLYLK
jgi:hypothetical protein